MRVVVSCCCFWTTVSELFLLPPLPLSLPLFILCPVLIYGLFGNRSMHNLLGEAIIITPLVPPRKTQDVFCAGAAEVSP